MPKIDVDAVLAAKAPRIARWVPGFVIRWLKRTIHQDEINYILDEYSALPPQQFIQACFKFWGVTYSVEGLEKLDPKGRYLFASNHPFGGMDGMMLADELVGYFGDARRAAATALDPGEQARFAMRGIPAQVRRSFCKRLSDSDLPGRALFAPSAGGGVRFAVAFEFRQAGGGVRAPDRAGFRRGRTIRFLLPPFQFSEEDRYPVQYRDALSARRDVFAEGKTFPDTGRGACFDGRAGRMRIVAAAGGLRTRKGVFFGKKVACRSKTRINCLVLL